ncbi:uncharacterized protein PHALS_12494 [Plasmopara halstedii]|uniref:Uncharacterized protein n=1 Tax=Plasmopara halstedii TaxID=4781 RepID=A0A0P1AM42_PLAHL|nr:uncharacterized protein PHALS_12494 [Plasmopara halstedii]CEG42200.1 hypothetical protein PHALS_12494 [Plasmopara halstedii]|eukprot:XP_024578569.1 hypothetical protein PHALS_12494 [Plasmopara halstedii]
MTATTKKCLKLHKLFVAELARSSQLETEGSRVLSSLANVSQRIPILLKDDDNSKVMGVLQFSCSSQALLLQKHFLALETSYGFLTTILRDYQEMLRHLRSFTNECVTLVDQHITNDGDSTEDESAAMTFSMKLQEWMETVLTMFEHEVLRKSSLVANLEYSDLNRLTTASKQWKANGRMGNIDYDYVQTGLPMPKNLDSRAINSDNNEIVTKKRKKKKKKAIKGQN